MIGVVSRTRATLTALTLIPTLLVAGCSDDDPKPKFEPTPSPSSTSPSSTATPALGPEETVRAWVDGRNAALANGDLAQVLALTSSRCKSCEGILNPIRQVYDNGGSFDTAGWRIVASRIKSKKATKVTVSAGLEFAAGRTVPEAGAEPVVYDAEKHIVVFKLIESNEAWAVDYVGFLS
jgi:hypothetical protein